MKICSDFLPTITNHGLCMTKNAGSLKNIFKSSEYMSKFQGTFYPSRFQHDVQSIERDLAKHHFTFLVDGQSYNDLKRGNDWKTISNTIFDLGIHGPNDTADIRRWLERIISIPSGYISKISLKPLQIKADETLLSLDQGQRGCRFTKENKDLTSVKSYSKINCLLDCKMEEAERICDCRPWDYPTANHDDSPKAKNRTKLCDFYGTTCFNMVLQENVESTCHEKCVPNCDEISYSFIVSQEPIDPEKRICSYFGHPSNDLEQEIKKYMMSQLVHGNPYGNNSDYIAASPPEKRILNLIRGILSKSEFSHYIDEKIAFEKDCEAKIKSDIAVVIVSIDSPKFTRMIKSAKVSFFDKLAILGRFIQRFEGIMK